jgi:hypothetical protein
VPQLVFARKRETRTFRAAIITYMHKFDLSNPDPTVTNALARLQAALATPNLGEAVRLYFGADSSFAGHTFDELGNNPPDQITSDDLLAVTLLDVPWSPPAVRALLGEEANHLNGLLEAVDSNTTLWDGNRGCQELTKASALWSAVVRLPGVGPTRAGKLLARKRPLLVPIVDSVVVSAVGNSGRTWATLRYCFKQESFKRAVGLLRSQESGDASLLRIFDVAIWMLCSNSRDAREARMTAGVSRDSCHCKPSDM